MKVKKYILIFLIITSLSHSQSGGDFSINKSTIASGGGTSNGGNYAVAGTIGQVDASEELTGGNFRLTGGFWNNRSINSDIIFKNSFE